MNTIVRPVILCGGSGSRLWPLSREHYPKQLLPLLNNRTMLQNTVERLAGISNVASPIVVCNVEHRFLVAEQLREIGVKPMAIILEPVGRNTAPAVCLAALHVLSIQVDPLLLVLPADHAITDVDGFREAVEDSVDYASSGCLVTYGVVPSRVETGYGYIKTGAAMDGGRGRKVECFSEKPDQDRAVSYVESGEWLWNSGMFLFGASRYCEELSGLASLVLSACTAAMNQSRVDYDFIRPNPEAFVASPNDSIDYAVMEKTEKAVVIPLDVGWNDIGSWSALWKSSALDADGNALKGDVIALDVRNSYVHARDRLVAVVGVKDLVVVETVDAILVVHKDRVQDVKDVVRRLKAEKREHVITHRKIYTPWGNYEGIDVADRFQVKRITVNPGASISMQMHYHRAEHWVVVKGTARVTRGDEVMLLSENQSTHIPLGTIHRLENPGKIPLELIEVQAGAYLAEDDIVRFEDQWGRI